MKTTGRNITNAIKKATGWDVKVHKSDGVVSFYSDDDEQSDKLAGFYTKSVYVMWLYSMTVDEWVREFEWLLAEYHFSD